MGTVTSHCVVDSKQADRHRPAMHRRSFRSRLHRRRRTPDRSPRASRRSRRRTDLSVATLVGCREGHAIGLRIDRRHARPIGTLAHGRDAVLLITAIEQRRAGLPSPLKTDDRALPNSDVKFDTHFRALPQSPSTLHGMLSITRVQRSLNVMSVAASSNPRMSRRVSGTDTHCLVPNVVRRRNPYGVRTVRSSHRRRR